MRLLALTHGLSLARKRHLVPPSTKPLCHCIHPSPTKISHGKARPLTVGCSLFDRSFQTLRFPLTSLAVLTTGLKLAPPVIASMWRRLWVVGKRLGQLLKVGSGHSHRVTCTNQRLRNGKQLQAGGASASPPAFGRILQRLEGSNLY